MSKAASSPTARLLQSSRIFSLPRPLPQAALESLSATGVFRHSETATKPYPTHQAIATTPSSLPRGDFGLKRALPGKTIRNTSTPHLRIEAQDSPEHITDFTSAADHTQTLQKWLEMGVPIVKHEPRRTVSNRSRGKEISVFTGPDSTDPANAGEGRWKFTGPWMAGMQDGQFDSYLKKKIGSRKAEWRYFLAQKMVEESLSAKVQEAQEEGLPLSAAAQAELKPSLFPTPDEVEAYQKDLRDRHAVDKLSSNLTSLISSFLDAPGIFSGIKGAKPYNPAQTPQLSQWVDNLDADANAADSAAPSTHPSAGLSHLMTNAVMDNHPIYGPQAHRAPVLGRVLRPRQTALMNWDHTLIGVGGITAPDNVMQLSTPGMRRPTGAQNGVYDAQRMADQLDPDLPGGNKMWVHPQSASIDEKGRIQLRINRAQHEAIAVKTGDVASIHESRSAADRIEPMSAPGTAGNANYGFSLPRTGFRGRSRVEGFDKDDKRTERIRGLLNGQKDDAGTE